MSIQRETACHVSIRAAETHTYIHINALSKLTHNSPQINEHQKILHVSIRAAETHTYIHTDIETGSRTAPVINVSLIDHPGPLPWTGHGRSRPPEPEEDDGRRSYPSWVRAREPSVSGGPQTRRVSVTFIFLVISYFTITYTPGRQ